MNPRNPPAPDTAGEVSALIQALHETGQRLEELTASAVDTVADRDGRTFVLRRAQEQLRHSEAARQEAILNALPAHIALLDNQGRIVSVNAAWRQFAGANALLGPDHGIGLNYLEICDHARGVEASEAHQAAAGIRSVLDGGVKSFSLEYPCHSPMQRRWFLLTVTPLADVRPNGAVVMHLDITERKRAEQALVESKEHFRFLSDLTEATRMLAEPEQIMAVMSRMLGEHLRASRCAYADVESDGEQFTILHDYTDGCVSTVGTYQLSLFGARAVATLNSGQILVIRRVEAELLPGEGADMFNAIGIKAIISCPLVKDGRLRAIMAVHQTTSRDWKPGEITLVQDVVERCWATIERRTAEERLRQSEALLRIAGRTARLGGWAVDLPERRITWSDEVCAIHDVPPGTVPGFEQASSFYAPQSRETVNKAFKACAQQGTPFDLELEVITAKGRRVWVRSIGEAQRNAAGAITRVQGAFQDITDRREAEIKIGRLNRVYAVLSGINAAIVRIRNRGELFQEVCRIIVEQGRFTLGWIASLDHTTGKLTAVAQAGLPANAGTDSDLFDGSTALVPGGTAVVALREKHSAIDNAIEDAPGLVLEHEADTLKVRRAAIRLGARSVIVLPLVVEGETFGILTLYAPERNFFDDEEIKLLNDLAGDVSFGLEFIAKEEKVDYLAYYDALTGLANRTLFLDRVGQHVRSAVSAGHQLALFLVDLERFKNINDSLGQAAGDELLRQVAQWLTQNVGDPNLLARVGADHFAVVLPEVKPDGNVAGLVESTMNAFMDHPFRLDEAVFRLAAKVGAALFPDDGTTADALFRNAEAALKKAKASGDRYLFYTQKMTSTVAGKLTLENQLRQALDNEEFVLHYQPKVTLAHSKLTGVEALIRWNDPRTGLVPPGRFIPILEETGLIYEVGRWALRKAVEDYLRWRAIGLDAVRIAVNVSPLQLRNRGFIAEIEQAVGIDAHAAAGLELEITENLIMEDVRYNISCLHAIRDMGISIAIDDFGTGFSSLSYLAKLPVDTLKIDRSFVVDMTSVQQGLALVSTIINLAHSLKLKVVAEGVETEEQSRLLRLLNCDEMQGYLFSKPVPSDILEARFLRPGSTGSTVAAAQTLPGDA